MEYCSSRGRRKTTTRRVNSVCNVVIHGTDLSGLHLEDYHILKRRKGFVLCKLIIIRVRETFRITY